MSLLLLQSSWNVRLDMKKFGTLLFIAAVLMGATPLTLSAQERPSTKIVNRDEKNKKSTYKSKRDKKVVRNYTHTLPADGATATTRSAAKKYHKITKLALKNSFQKWSVRKS
jgi:hypothetical protein